MEIYVEIFFISFYFVVDVFFSLRQKGENEEGERERWNTLLISYALLQFCARFLKVNQETVIGGRGRFFFSLKENAKRNR